MCKLFESSYFQAKNICRALNPNSEVWESFGIWLKNLVTFSDLRYLCVILPYAATLTPQHAILRQGHEESRSKNATGVEDGFLPRQRAKRPDSSNTARLLPG